MIFISANDFFKLLITHFSTKTFKAKTLYATVTEQKTTKIKNEEKEDNEQK